MSKTLEFYFDFGSPTAYLAHKRLQQLSDQYDLEVRYTPMLLGGAMYFGQDRLDFIEEALCA